MSLARYPGSGNGGDGGYPAPLTIQAESYSAVSGIDVTTSMPNYTGTGHLDTITAGDWVAYSVNCGRGVNTFSWRCNTGSCWFMELRQGSNTGTLLGRVLHPPDTGWGTWVTWTNWIAPVRGLQTLVLVAPAGVADWQVPHIDTVTFSWTDSLGA